jgi:thiol:disulfide interchange protein DsbC
MNERQKKGAGVLKLLVILPALILAALLCRAGTAGAEDSLDLTKAVKVGSGKTMVIEFTDPDCPFCRQAEAFLRKKDVTRYIFFLPLPNHPASKGKVQYILSAKDKARAYLEVTSGIFDNGQLGQITPEGVKLQEEQLKIVKANHIKSTPSFMIYGRIIVGFDQNKLNELIP